MNGYGTGLLGWIMMGRAGVLHKRSSQCAAQVRVLPCKNAGYVAKHLVFQEKPETRISVQVL